MTEAIVLAAGRSTRMQGDINKLLLPIHGKPLLQHTLDRLRQHPEIDKIILVSELDFPDAIPGGNSWAESLKKGLEKATGDIILIQNGANPLPSNKEISQNIALAKQHGAAISGRYATSTVKEVDEFVLKTHDRSRIFLAETPQTAQRELLVKALAEAPDSATDAAMMLEAIDVPVALVEASEDNFKVTTWSDYQRLRQVMGEAHSDYLVGTGTDSHIFSENELGLTLAGVKFPEEKKLHANSDGDVILHAIFNAISQALGDKSLGHYADPLCEKGITDSREYLQIMLDKASERGYKLNNLGLMLECKKPKIDPIATQLKDSLSKILQLPAARIGITATTGEGLTPFGRGQGMQCIATVSLKTS